MRSNAVQYFWRTDSACVTKGYMSTHNIELVHNKSIQHPSASRLNQFKIMFKCCVHLKMFSTNQAFGRRMLFRQSDLKSPSCAVFGKARRV